MKNKPHINIGQIMKTPNNDKIMQALRLPISGVKPISAQFITTAAPKKKMLIEPQKNVTEFSADQHEKIETWLSFCAIGTSMLDVGTKALRNLQVIDKRDAVFDLVTAFKQLRKHFSGNENFDKTENEMNDFLFTFLHLPPDQQKRVVKFQESIIR